MSRPSEDCGFFLCRRRVPWPWGPDVQTVDNKAGWLDRDGRRLRLRGGRRQDLGVWRRSLPRPDVEILFREEILEQAAVLNTCVFHVCGYRCKYLHVISLGTSTLHTLQDFPYLPQEHPGWCWPHIHHYIYQMMTDACCHGNSTTPGLINSQEDARAVKERRGQERFCEPHPKLA